MVAWELSDYAIDLLVVEDRQSINPVNRVKEMGVERDSVQNMPVNKVIRNNAKDNHEGGVWEQGSGPHKRNKVHSVLMQINVCLPSLTKWEGNA